MIEKIENLLFEYSSIVKRDEVVLNEKTNIISDLGYSSLSLIQFVIEIENEFNIQIELKDISSLYSYGILKRYILSHYYYDEYYRNYIGIIGKESVGPFYYCTSKYRDIPMNKKYLYSIIITKYRNDYVISCSDEYKKAIIDDCSCLKKDEDIEYYKDKMNSYGLKKRTFYRLIWDGYGKCTPYYNQKYEYVYLEQYNKYVAKENGNTIAYCKISDICCDFGNIVVYTDEKYRRTGVATCLLSLMLSKCQEKGIFPLYVVDVTNVGSLGLAKKLGFSIMNTEIVLSKEILNHNI